MADMIDLLDASNTLATQWERSHRLIQKNLHGNIHMYQYCCDSAFSAAVTMCYIEERLILERTRS